MSQNVYPRMWALLLIAICAVSISPTKAEDAPNIGWQCTADKSSGFIYDAKTKTWDAAAFHTDNKYWSEGQLSRIIQDGLNRMGIGEAAPVAYVLVKVGDRDQYPYVCENLPNEKGLLFCENGLDVAFLLDTRQLRMQRYHGLGYIFSFGDGDDQADTPFIEIGRCALL